MLELVSTNSAAVPKARLRLPLFQYMRVDWLARAAVLPGRTLHYATAVLALASLMDSPTISPGAKTLARYGVSPDAAGDAMTRLVTAGLAKADRRRGRAARITLLDGRGDLLELRRVLP